MAREYSSGDGFRCERPWSGSGAAEEWSLDRVLSVSVLLYRQHFSRLLEAVRRDARTRMVCLRKRGGDDSKRLVRMVVILLLDLPLYRRDFDGQLNSISQDARIFQLINSEIIMSVDAALIDCTVRYFQSRAGGIQQFAITCR